MKYQGSKEEWQHAYERETKSCGKESAKVLGYTVLASISIWQLTRHAFNTGSHAVARAITKDAINDLESCSEEE